MQLIIDRTIFLLGAETQQNPQTEGKINVNKYSHVK